MARVIQDLNLSTWHSVKQLLPRLGTIISKNEKAGICDVELSENVILKIYDDEIVLDLGDEYVILRFNEFSTITIG